MIQSSHIIESGETFAMDDGDSAYDNTFLINELILARQVAL